MHAAPGDIWFSVCRHDQSGHAHIFGVSLADVASCCATCLCNTANHVMLHNKANPA
jgi:hypothetical protein